MHGSGGPDRPSSSRSARGSGPACGARRTGGGWRQAVAGVLFCALAVARAGDESEQGEGVRGERRQVTGLAPPDTRGVVIGETFVPGTTGAEWPTPLPEDLTRVNKYSGLDAITDWPSTSWSQVDCCQYLATDTVFEDIQTGGATGTANCFCRDVLTRSWYKSVAFCALKQSCENALRDFNKVFGEGRMVIGQGAEWHTESPLRSCMTTDPIRGAVSTSCGEPNEDTTLSWRDPYGRDPRRYTSILARPEYGTIKTPADDTNIRAYHWVPGDQPNRQYHGFQANDGIVQEGLMSGTDVYPGVNHSQCCVENATLPCCRNSTFMTWRSPSGPVQADCMFAVKRALCAYHFWECDASYPGKIYNGVCKDTCDDIPRLCGTIPSTGEPLQLHHFTLSNFYHLGCTQKQREIIKDCTAGGGKAIPPTLKLLLALSATVAAAAVVWL